MAISAVNPAFDIDTMTNHFLAAHLEGNLENPDLILCTLRPKPEIIRIRNHTVERGLGSAWIGNQDAFNDLGAAWGGNRRRGRIFVGDACSP